MTKDRLKQRRIDVSVYTMLILDFECINVNMTFFNIVLGSLHFLIFKLSFNVRGMFRCARQQRYENNAFRNCCEYMYLKIACVRLLHYAESCFKVVIVTDLG